MINKELEELKKNESPQYFIDLINCIVTYYISYSEDEFDSSEDWKRKAGLIKKPIPEDLDRMIKRSFKKQLKTFCK